MTDDEIISRAKSLGWNIEHAQSNVMLILFARDIEDLVRYQEREACAKVCEEYNKRQCYNDEDMAVANECAEAIRARGQA